jgi:Aminoglycoside 3-N-acetyltransferase
MRPERSDRSLARFAWPGWHACNAGLRDRSGSRQGFLVDRVPVYTGLLCEAFRRTPGVRRSIHLSSSVCAIGPNADYLIRDHHLTAMAWGKDSPFCRLMDVDEAVFNFLQDGRLDDVAPAYASSVRRPCTGGANILCGKRPADALQTNGRWRNGSCF